jgi:S-formylglutathione hydrolase FrmB
MTLTTVSQNRSYGGTQGVYRHASQETKTDMTFSVYVPSHEAGAKLPVVWYLSGLTCTHANVTEKGEFRAACAEHGIVFVAPDTSPRGMREALTISASAPASTSMRRRSRLPVTTACGATSQRSYRV